MAKNNNRKGNNKNHPFVKVKRRIRLTYLKILRLDDPPERIARGAAIGVLMGILPTFGLGGVFALALAFVLRANKAAAIIGSFIMNPITSPFFWTLSVVIGSVILRQDYNTMLSKFRGESLLKGAEWVYVVFLTGNVILAAVLTAASYYLVKNAIIRHRKHKAEKRLARLEGKSPEL